MKGHDLFNVAILFSLSASLLAIGCGQSSLPVQSSSPAPAPLAITISIFPDSLSIRRGNSWNFAASVANSGDQTVSWTIQEGSAGGVIGDTGVYTAPASAGVYHIVATSKADSSKSATATVSVGIAGFTSTGSLEQARFANTATLLPNGKVYVAGGATEADAQYDGVAVMVQDELFDPATGTFQPAGKLTRDGHTATRLLNGDVLFTGGFSDVTDEGPILSSTGELLKAGSGMFQPTGSLSVARYSHTATLLQDGKVLITGGYTSSTSPIQTAELYDPASDTFVPVGNMAIVRPLHFATLLTNGKVLIAGGGSTTVELFDPATNSFTPGGSTSSRSIGAVTLLADGRVLISGEANADDSAPAPSELYDPATGKFTPTGTMATLRYGYSATLLSDGTVLVAGGAVAAPGPIPATYYQDPVAVTEIYNPATGSFSPGPTMRSARYSHTATLMPDGSVLLVGGCCVNSSNAANGSAEVYQ